MAAKKYSLKNKAKREPGTSMSAPDKMQLLFTVIPRVKTEYYIDLIGSFEVNMQMVVNGQGTAAEKHLALLGLTDSDKTVIISAIRRDRAKDALFSLEEKFKTVKGGKGIAFTVPMKSTIGVAIYQFLSNKK